MAIPGNMWIYDDGGALIKGGCDVADREFSIEFKGFHHNLSFPLIMPLASLPALVSTHQ